MKTAYVYILSNKKNGTLYVGVTTNLVKRIWEHKNKVVKGFTEKYDVHQLVYFEIHGDMLVAFEREKKLKKWPRQWKINLIQEKNPEWQDLYLSIL